MPPTERSSIPAATRPSAAAALPIDGAVDHQPRARVGRSRAPQPQPDRPVRHAEDVNARDVGVAARAFFVPRARARSRRWRSGGDGGGGGGGCRGGAGRPTFAGLSEPAAAARWAMRAGRRRARRRARSQGPRGRASRRASRRAPSGAASRASIAAILQRVLVLVERRRVGGELRPAAAATRRNALDARLRSPSGARSRAARQRWEVAPAITSRANGISSGGGAAPWRSAQTAGRRHAADQWRGGQQLLEAVERPVAVQRLARAAACAMGHRPRLGAAATSSARSACGADGGASWERRWSAWPCRIHSVAWPKSAASTVTRAPRGAAEIGVEHNLACPWRRRG